MTTVYPIICHVCKGEGIVWKRVGFPPVDEYFKCGACNGEGSFYPEVPNFDLTTTDPEWPDEETDTFPSEPDPTA